MMSTWGTLKQTPMTQGFEVSCSQKNNCLGCFYGTFFSCKNNYFNILKNE